MKLKYLVTFLVALMLVAGCAAKDDKKDESIEDTAKKTEEKADEKQENNKELTGQMEKEKGVTKGQAYVKEGKAVGKLELDKDVSDEDAQKLVEKYAEALKTEYKDMPIDVEATRDGKKVAEKTLPAQPEQPAAPSEPQAVSAVGGKVVYDGILQAYAIRIPAENVNATDKNVLQLTVGEAVYDLTYDAERKVFLHGAVYAESKEQVLNSTFIIK